MGNSEGTYISHNCNEAETWVHQGDNACYTRCTICGRITGFHYRSFGKRLRALFNFNGAHPVKLKEEMVKCR